ncbi:MAG: deoxyribose-phosphate aldolase [Bacteroidaceae bacterium]|nr:deoxyribose-phosphate aldolase [Bacteroidaceae bacterium]
MTNYTEMFEAYHCAELNDERVHHEVMKLLEEKQALYDTDEVKEQLLRAVELTTLTVTDSQESVLKFTENVNNFYEDHPELPAIATICVYPNFAKIVSESLEVENTAIACVSGGFPSAQTFLEIKTIETALAIKDGATEIDMVLGVGAFLSEDYETCYDEISEIKDVCHDVPLKVILETGALQSAQNIKKAAVLTMYAGADFIKTSTGKISISATPEAAYVMCKAIKEYKAQTGRWVGFKAAGGIKTVEDAVAYYTIVRELLGQEFIDKNLFRIGTSSLANKLVNEILREEVNPF